jgi:eukaryotic-like serine/threonine-protein kinase
MLSRLTKITVAIIAFLFFAGVGAFVTITFLIRSEKAVVVPQLVGKDVVQVLQVLSALKLNTQLTESRHSVAVPRNHIIFQDPSPGTEIKTNRSVRIILSKGIPHVLIPDLTGLSLQQTYIVLEEKNLCNGRVSYTSHANIEATTIAAQFPSPGVRVEKGRCVDLLVSTGPKNPAHLMPRLLSLSLDEALGIIEKMNLKPGRIDTHYIANTPRNHIINQQPDAGHRVLEGSLVNLTINKNPTKNGQSLSFETGFIRHRVGMGFLKKHVRIRLKGFGISDDILNVYVPPGEEIWLLIPTIGESTVIVYEDDEIVMSKVFN